MHFKVTKNRPIAKPPTCPLFRKISNDELTETWITATKLQLEVSLYQTFFKTGSAVETWIFRLSRYVYSSIISTLATLPTYWDDVVIETGVTVTSIPRHLFCIFLWGEELSPFLSPKKMEWLYAVHYRDFQYTK
jgi:hypothetical protein